MSRGPSIPVKCSTIELKYLADTLDFDKEGKEGSIYGLELNEKGLYVRKEIEENKQQFPKLQQIRDLDTTSAENDKEYNLKRVNNKWIINSLPVKIPWLILFEFFSPHTLIGNDNTFRKCLNQGPQLISLVPAISDTIKIKPFLQDKYTVYVSDVTERKKLEFKPPIALGQSWTIMIDLMLLKANASINKQITDILTGVRISWTETTDTRVKLFIQNNNGSIVSKSTSDQMSIDTARLTNMIEWMEVTNVNLIGFYFTASVLTEYQLAILSGI